MEHWGLLAEPLMVLSGYLKQQSQAEYYRSVSTICSEGDWEGWVSFFLEGVAAASADAERSIIDVASLITADRNRLLASPKAGPTSYRLFELLPMMPRFNVEHVRQRLETMFPTASAAVKLLEDLGILAGLTGQKKNRVYSYHAYVDLLSAIGCVDRLIAMMFLRRKQIWQHAVILRQGTGIHAGSQRVGHGHGVATRSRHAIGGGTIDVGFRPRAEPSWRGRCRKLCIRGDRAEFGLRRHQHEGRHGDRGGDGTTRRPAQPRGSRRRGQRLCRDARSNARCKTRASQQRQAALHAGLGEVVTVPTSHGAAIAIKAAQQETRRLAAEFTIHEGGQLLVARIMAHDGT
ncbi:MAG: hypothetical protein M0P72_01320 [Metallibacterium scheffleri]|jgi:hypothetical protein|uniref:hypothetical protein n=1 Tax=Metallibacterium scheffleri TaxID=993689 RepID=UPI0026F2A8A2|nr:hypothetical protein [Metallibacterium scheffleri]MCK9365778.1 hypothetical protein [Metallibacterium scheffleri]